MTAEDEALTKLQKSGEALCAALQGLADACREASDTIRKLRDAAQPPQTLSGNAPIASAERILQHGPDNHGLDADRER